MHIFQQRAGSMPARVTVSDLRSQRLAIVRPNKDSLRPRFNDHNVTYGTSSENEKQIRLEFEGATPTPCSLCSHGAAMRKLPSTACPFRK